MAEQEKPQEKNNKKIYSGWFGLGIEFCAVVGLFCYIGYKLDEKFNTSPWLLLTGFFIGFTGMMYIIIKDTLIKQNKDKK